ncbi:MAG TPA: CsbD family protein [Terriglobia bacterium]|nr:CsbD family protein [Terriglobia bacterium]
MNSDILKGRWVQLKGDIRARWGKLTDDDLAQIQGEAEKMIGKLQERYGYKREQAEKELNDFLNARSGQPRRAA